MNIKNKTIMVVTSAMLALWTLGAQALEEATTAAVAKRLAPVGEVCLQGEPCATGGAGSTAEGARSGETVVNTYCTACHATGILQAPKVGDTAAWQARADAKGGLDGLLASALSGFNAMPPKGTCADCSDDELMSAIKQMSGL